MPASARVVAILEEARSRVARAVNSEMILAYWHIGREIVDEVQRGAERAKYGERVIRRLSTRLTERYGRGFSKRNVEYIRAFYITFRTGAQRSCNPGLRTPTPRARRTSAAWR